MRPGQLLLGAGSLVLNVGRPTVEVAVRNASSHTVHVSSHYPFFEVNRRLCFDRARAWGMHLDIPAGDAVRWAPGETKTVRLVAYGGRRAIHGFHGLTNGPADADGLAEGLRRAERQSFSLVSSLESPDGA
jgi:urease beta subunit